MAVEARTLKYDVFANFEAIVKFGDHRVEFFPVVFGDVSRCPDVLCCLSHTVEQHGQLLHVYVARPDALWNCWKCLVQRDQSSGDLKLKGTLGCEQTALLAIMLHF